MKFVILEKPGALPRIELGLAPRLHSEIAAPAIADGFVVKSGGFLEFTARGTIHPFGHSQSLNTKPRPEDAAIITAFYRNTVEQGRP